MAYYECANDDTFLDRREGCRGHFWHDVRRIPLIMELSNDKDLDATIGRRLEQAIPIQTLGINYPVRDDALKHLNGLNDGCEVFFWHAENLSAAALGSLQRRMPSVEFMDVR